MLCSRWNVQLYCPIIIHSCGFSWMIECPPLILSPSAESFLHVFDVLFAINMLINPYVFYCIIYRSPRTMNRYRWFLLWHQILSLISDISVPFPDNSPQFQIDFLAQPVLFVPFIMGYPRGVLRGLVPTHFINEFCVFFFSISFVSYIHLFVFRYLTIMGYDYFPGRWIALVAFCYILGSLPGIAVALTHGDEMKVFQELQAVRILMQIFSGH